MNSLRLPPCSRRACLWLVLLPMGTPLVAAFPLTTDDTGSQGHGHSKIELTYEREMEREQGAREVVTIHEISLVHGLTSHFDTTFTLPYRTLRETEINGAERHVGGVGDLKFGLKWRYFERDQLSLGLKASVSLPTGDALEKLGSGKPTQSINAIASYADAPWKFHVNLAYSQLRNTRNQRVSLARLSSALVRNLGGGWKVMADVGVANSKDKATHQALVFVGVGVAYAVSKDLALELGVKRGLSAAEVDFTGLAGFSLRF